MKIGFCQCGCGQKTNIAPQTAKEKGWIKGEPIRFIKNHKTRKSYTVDEKSGCWIWDGPKCKNGYFQTKVNGKYVLAHRYMYEKIKGDIPRDMVLDHLCRNSKCCNPEHLEAVSFAENTRRGKVAKITMKDAEKIRGMCQYMTHKDISGIYGISSSNVSYINSMKTWK